MGPNPEITHLLALFACQHLPQHLQGASRPFSEAAHGVINNPGPRVALIQELRWGREADASLKGFERAAMLVKLEEAEEAICEGDEVGALRLLLEAKDCAVRARL